MPAAKRTQVYMAPQTYRLLERLAGRRRTSVAALVREVLDRYLSAQGREQLHDEDSLWGLLGITEGHQRDGAARHDDYLFGTALENVRWARVASARSRCREAEWP